MTVRVRIAPSPTGHLHVGNVRSALFNWLFARHHGGTFILRIDDTDLARSEQQFADDILAGLRWLGLDWDEGVEVGGPHGTYRQSDRFDRYREVAEDLLERGLAYHDFRSTEELEALRTRAQREQRAPGFYIRTPDDHDLDRSRARLEAGETAVVRFSVPQGDPVTFTDIVRDEMVFESHVVDDFVILRSDGTPTYHLASTVDDVDYGITHIARGEDLLSSTPKHILLTAAMGAEHPRYAHLPLLVGPDGKKLSKRHGDTSLRAYREGGYLADAMFNYMSLLGWSPGEDREVFTRQEAIEAFDLDDVQKSAAVFDLDKLGWMNGLYIRAMDPDDFAAAAVRSTELTLGRDLDAAERERLGSIAPLVQERVKFIGEIGPSVRFFFEEVAEFDESAWAKTMKDGSSEALLAAAESLAAVEEWTTPAIEAALRAMLDEQGLNARKGLQPIRVAVTGSNVSPPLFETLEVLGRDVTLARIDAARKLLNA